MPVVDPLMPTRRATLDMLRGVAILLVIGRHLPLHTLDNPILATWFRLGWTGVDLFFVLSRWVAKHLGETEYLWERGLQSHARRTKPESPAG